MRVKFNVSGEYSKNKVESAHEKIFRSGWLLGDICLRLLIYLF